MTMTDAPTAPPPTDAAANAAAAYADELVPVLAELITEHAGAKGTKAEAAARAIVEHMTSTPAIKPTTPIAGVVAIVQHLAAALPPIPEGLDVDRAHEWRLEDGVLPVDGQELISLLRAITPVYSAVSVWNTVLQTVRRQLWQRGRTLDMYAPAPLPGDPSPVVPTAALAAASGVTPTMVRTATATKPKPEPAESAVPVDGEATSTEG